MQYMAPDFNPAKGFLVMPLENQFYIGFYNKALFKKAGISGPPANWSELLRPLREAEGQGHHTDDLRRGHPGASAHVLPFYDFSYPMTGILSPAQWRGLYTGKSRGTRRVVSQLNKWAALPKDGCTNKDVLTKTTSSARSSKGKAAMIFDGNWDTATLQKGLGKKLGLSPRRTRPEAEGVIQYPGDGFSVTKLLEAQGRGRRSS